MPGTAIGGFPTIATVLCPWWEGIVRKMVEKRWERWECLAHRTVKGGRSAGADRGRGSGLMIPSPIPTVATPAQTAVGSHAMMGTHQPNQIPKQW